MTEPLVVPHLDPRMQTHLLRDDDGLTHRPVQSVDDASLFSMFCVTMDAIERKFTEPGVTFVGSVSAYRENRLVVDKLTCVRCAAGLRGWK